MSETFNHPEQEGKHFVQNVDLARDMADAESPSRNEYIRKKAIAEKVFGTDIPDYIEDQLASLIAQGEEKAKEVLKAEEGDIKRVFWNAICNEGWPVLYAGEDKESAIKLREKADALAESLGLRDNFTMELNGPGEDRRTWSVRVFYHKSPESENESPY